MYNSTIATHSAMQQQLQRAAAGSLRTPGLGLFTRAVTAGMRSPTLQQNAALGGRVRAPAQVI